MTTGRYWLWLFLVHAIAWAIVYIIYGLADWEVGNRLLVPFLIGGVAFSVSNQIGDYYHIQQKKMRR